MKKLILTWDAFDCAVELIASAVEGRVSSVYGVPRGGLPLAVALSHRLNVPLTFDPWPSALIVDDVIETGATVERFAGHDPSLIWAWINKSPDPNFNSVVHDKAAGWIVFPWEARDSAERDANDYYARR